MDSSKLVLSFVYVSSDNLSLRSNEIFGIYFNLDCIWFPDQQTNRLATNQWQENIIFRDETLRYWDSNLPPPFFNTVPTQSFGVFIISIVTKLGFKGSKRIRGWRGLCGYKTQVWTYQHLAHIFPPVPVHPSNRDHQRSHRSCSNKKFNLPSRTNVSPAQRNLTFVIDVVLCIFWCSITTVYLCNAFILLIIGLNAFYS